MIFSLDYFNMYTSTKKMLNIENIESLSYANINLIGKTYKEKDFNHLKKKIFLSWFYNNSENTLSFSKRIKKLLKKLDIDLSEKEKEIIFNIEPREFTERRSMKTIEVPYSHSLYMDNIRLEKNIFFFYSDLRLYVKNNILLELKHKSDIYFSSKEIVLYDKTKKEIKNFFLYKDIKEVILKKYTVKINLINGEKIYLRHKDNELIFISLKRSSSNIKKHITFKNLSKQ